MTDLPPILCPDCGHSINAHVLEIDFERYFCGGTYGDCDCNLSPSGIARALLIAEPTVDEIDAAHGALHGHVVSFIPRMAIREALRAARKARP